MKFFVPAAKDREEAESVYGAFAKFIHAPVNKQRIWKLDWRHNGRDMTCEVGKPLPDYYRTGKEPVLAIFDTGNVYMICTPNRGGVRGEPVLAGKNAYSSPVYFENEE